MTSSSALLQGLSPKQMQLHFCHRRRAITQILWQLKLDVDDWNETSPPDGRYELVVDFRDDMAELAQPTTYQPRKCP